MISPGLCKRAANRCLNPDPGASFAPLFLSHYYSSAKSLKTAGLLGTCIDHVSSGKQINV
jgi:hypothetical protein